MAEERNLSRLKGAARVRLRPSVILGSDGIRGVQQTLFEVISNSIDRWKLGYGKTITVIRHQDHSFTIIDEADGLPCEWNEEEQAYNWDLALKTLYGGDNYEQTDEITGKLGNFGLGLTSTMYSSEYMNVDVYKNNKHYKLKFKEGRPIDKLTNEFICEDDDYTLSRELGEKALLIEDNIQSLTGTTINYKPDTRVFTDIKIDYEWIDTKFKKQAVVNTGLIIVFKDEVTNQEKTYKYSTLSEYVDEIGQEHGFSNTILFQGDSEGKDVETQDSYKVDYSMAFQFNNSIKLQEYYHNSSELTELKFNVTTIAVKNSFTNVINDFIIKNNLYNKNEKKIKFEDIEDSLICVLTSRSNKTSYANQTKLSIDNPFIKEFITNNIKEQLSIYFIENPLETIKILNQILVNKRAREKAEATKIATKKKLENGIKFTDNIKNFKPQIIKNKQIAELYVNEGTSALGGMLASRNEQFQAGFHVGGKMKSLLKATEKSLFANEVVNNLYKILGCGTILYKSKYNKEKLPAYDFNNFNWNKIVISTDQDIDAYQIRCLILTCIYVMSPDLLHRGVIYIAEAPLYEITLKDSEEVVFVYTEQEKEDKLAELKSKGIKYNTPERNKGLGQMDKFSMARAVMNPETRRIIKVTVSDVEEMMRTFDIWMGEDVEDRRSIITNNFDYVEYFEDKSEKDIVQVLNENYLPYAIDIVKNRAIIAVDGFKPAHRKLLWTLHEKKLYGKRTKSANIVGDNMSFNVHGDGSIYETLVRMAQSDTLLHPYVDGKGNFGFHTSVDVQEAHMRYTSAGAANINKEFFKDIEKNAVDMIPNFDGQKLEPSLLPTTFPNLLVNYNKGIAVGMASTTPSFPIVDVCNTTIEYINNKDIDILDYLIAPDVATGGYIIYNKKALEEIYSTGKGSLTLRGKYKFSNNEITITEIPYTTNVEAIVDRVKELCKNGDSNYKCITDVLDSTGLKGMSITISVKNNTDIEKLMHLLYRNTPLEAQLTFNMNIICLDNIPRVLGIKQILDEWLKFRTNCIKRALKFDIQNKSKELHLLHGLEKVLLDVDRTIEIIRYTNEKEVNNKLIKHFNIDELQANEVSNMKLKYINKDYIINKIKDVKTLENELQDLQTKLNSEEEINKIIINDLIRVRDTYGKPRKTEIIYPEQIKQIDSSELIPDHSVTMVFTKEQYLKKTLRYAEADKQKVKDGDIPISITTTTNRGETILLSNLGNAYKLQINDLQEKQPSAMGEYIPSLIELEPNEKIIGILATSDFKGYAIIVFENGKILKLPLQSYMTQTKRTKLKNSLNLDSPVVSIFQIAEDTDILLKSNQNKAVIVNTKDVTEKSSRNSQGATFMKSNKEDFRVVSAELYKGNLDDSYRTVKAVAGKSI